MHRNNSARAAHHRHLAEHLDGRSYGGPLEPLGYTGDHRTMDTLRPVASESHVWHASQAPTVMAARKGSGAGTWLLLLGVTLVFAFVGTAAVLKARPRMAAASTGAVTPVPVPMIPPATPAAGTPPAAAPVAGAPVTAAPGARAPVAAAPAGGPEGKATTDPAAGPRAVRKTVRTTRTTPSTSKTAPTPPAPPTATARTAAAAPAAAPAVTPPPPAAGPSEAAKKKATATFEQANAEVTF